MRFSFLFPLPLITPWPADWSWFCSECKHCFLVSRVTSCWSVLLVWERVYLDVFCVFFCSWHLTPAAGRTGWNLSTCSHVVSEWLMVIRRRCQCSSQHRSTVTSSDSGPGYMFVHSLVYWLTDLQFLYCLAWEAGAARSPRPPTQKTSFLLNSEGEI